MHNKTMEQVIEEANYARRKERVSEKFFNKALSRTQKGRLILEAKRQAAVVIMSYTISNGSVRILKK